MRSRETCAGHAGKDVAALLSKAGVSECCSCSCSSVTAGSQGNEVRAEDGPTEGWRKRKQGPGKASRGRGMALELKIKLYLKQTPLPISRL